MLKPILPHLPRGDMRKGSWGCRGHGHSALLTDILPPWWEWLISMFHVNPNQSPSTPHYVNCATDKTNLLSIQMSANYDAAVTDSYYHVCLLGGTTVSQRGWDTAADSIFSGSVFSHRMSVMVSAMAWAYQPVSREPLQWGPWWPCNHPRSHRSGGECLVLQQYWMQCKAQWKQLGFLEDVAGNGVTPASKTAYEFDVGGIIG